MFTFARSVSEKRISFLRAANDGIADLTVFVGTYNRLKMLKSTISSIFLSIGQRSVEIIINDAGSTDGTQKWLRHLADNDKRIVPIFSGKRTSFTQAFNEALQIAKGKYICWLSDDIISESFALSDMCNVMDKASPMDLGRFSVKNPGCEYFVRNKNWNLYSPLVGCMYTETLKKMNGFNIDYPYYTQDTDLNTRVLRLGGRVIACNHCKLTHNLIKDVLHISNNINHNNAMNESKYYFVNWRSTIASRFQYPTILLVSPTVCKIEDILDTVCTIRKLYINSHIFIDGEISQQLDTSSNLSFLHKIPKISKHTYLLFDIVIQIMSNGNNILLQPNKVVTAFSRKMVQKDIFV
jgi:GT2 family glycosyltransferase